MAPKITWILAADASRARVLQRSGRAEALVEIQGLDNPAGRAHDRDLVTDAHARFRGNGGPASDRQETSAVEHATDLFAKRLGAFLEKARAERRYDELVVVAPPKFLGALRAELDKETGKLVREEIPKDLSALNARELSQYFAKQQ